MEREDIVALIRAEIREAATGAKVLASLVEAYKEATIYAVDLFARELRQEILAAMPEVEGRDPAKALRERFLGRDGDHPLSGAEIFDAIDRAADNFAAQVRG